MKALRVALCACAASLGLATAAFSAPGSGLTGAWKATDISDGSNLTLAISAPQSDGVRHVTYFDQFASGAFCAPGAPAILNGEGTVSGDVLTASLSFRCAGFLFPGQLIIEFQTHSNGTITDVFGNVFIRAS